MFDVFTINIWIFTKPITHQTGLKKKTVSGSGFLSPVSRSDYKTNIKHQNHPSKLDKNNYNFRIVHSVRFVPMLITFVFKHIFFLLQRKFLTIIICYTINLCNFVIGERSGIRLNVIFRTKT